MTSNNNNSPNIELIWGAEAIASLIGRSRRVTYSMLEKGDLPARQIGTRWVAERGKLISFFLEDAE